MNGMSEVLTGVLIYYREVSAVGFIFGGLNHQDRMTTGILISKMER